MTRRSPSQTLHIPVLFARAIARNGIGNVLIFGVRLLQRRGLFGAVRYATLTTAQRQKKAARESRRSLIAEADVYNEALETDLDPSYGVALSRWKEIQISWADEPGPGVLRGPVESRIEIGVIISGEPISGDAIAKTLEALSTLASGSEKLLVKIYTEAIPLSEPLGGGLVRVPTLVELPQRETDWILYLGAGDKPAADLGRLLLDIDIATQVVTFDMMFIEDERVWPLLCPGANPTLAREFDYTFSRLVARPRLVHESYEFDRTYGYEILCRWLNNNSTLNAESYWVHLSKVISEISITKSELATRLEALPKQVVARPEHGRISIVICTKDKGHLLHQLVRSLWSLSANLIAEIVVVSNNTTNKYALEILEALSSDARILLYTHNEPFNFSRMSNLGARVATGDHILFLNDDIVPLTDDWLDALLETFNADSEVGVAGPLLLYPDERIQHAGMYLGFREAAGHVLRFAQLPEGAYLYYASARRQVSAVTGAVMLISRACFKALNGFDENLPTFLQDVDFCMRARHTGFVIVFDPAAILLHMESTTMKPLISTRLFADQRTREYIYYNRRWSKQDQIDPFHNPAFAVNDETLRTFA